MSLVGAYGLQRRLALGRGVAVVDHQCRPAMTGNPPGDVRHLRQTSRADLGDGAVRGVAEGVRHQRGGWGGR